MNNYFRVSAVFKYGPIKNVTPDGSFLPQSSTTS
jgi:hypothetical protein